MMIATVSALTCPACGGPVTSHTASRCRFCGVALVIPGDGGDEPVPEGEPAAIRRAITRLREQLRLDPTRSETHRQLGLAYRALGLTEDAVRALTAAVGLAPEVIALRLELATLLASQSAAGVPDAFPAAMRHVRQVLALEPESTDGRLLLARLQTQRGEYGEAHATLSCITSLPPHEIRRRVVWVTLAEAAGHERRGDRRGAVAAWRRVAVEAPDLVRPAVASFLARTPVMGTAVGTRRFPAQALLRAVLIATVAVLGGLALGLPLPVLIAVVGVAVSLTVSGWRIGFGRVAIEATGRRSRPLPQPRPEGTRGSPARSTAKGGFGSQVPGKGSTWLHQRQVLLVKRPFALDRQRMTGRSGSARLDADLARMLRVAELVAARADLAERQRQFDWADNLAVALPRR